INHGGENRGGIEPEPEPLTPPDSGGVPLDNSAENNDLQEPIFQTVENDPVTSVHFTESLEAAAFYAGDGWNVLPICNFNPATGRCTAPWHPETCTGKKPMVKGSGAPGDGYTAATTDLEKLRHFYRKYPDAGVGIRLDGHILIDCDVKDGGLES